MIKNTPTKHLARILLYGYICGVYHSHDFRCLATEFAWELMQQACLPRLVCNRYVNQTKPRVGRSEKKIENTFRVTEMRTLRWIKDTTKKRTTSETSSYKQMPKYTRWQHSRNRKYYIDMVTPREEKKPTSDEIIRKWLYRGILKKEPT